MSETATSTPLGLAGRLRQVAAASVGNAIEWYDWYTYTFLATTFGPLIFPSHSPVASALSTFAVFAVGFFMRPIGGLLLGSVADRFGRRTALTVTILLMGFGSLLVGIVPTYTAVGVLAPIILVLARLISGLSIGGEFAASTTFLVESAGPRRRGLFASFQYVSTTIGQLIASGLSALLVGVLSEHAMTGWGWRIPFLLGAVLALFGLWLRRGVRETKQVAATERPRFYEALVRFPKQSLLIVGITVGGTIAYYSWTAYLPTYAQQNHGFDKGESLIVSTIALAFFAIIQPLGGMLSDRIGRKPMLLVFSGGFTVLTVPLLMLLTDSFGVMLAITLVGMILLTGYTSIAAAINAEIFPARVRASGIGFPYSLAVALFGGTAPYMGTLFKSLGHAGLFPYYIAGLCAVSFVVYLFLTETAKKPLEV
ncbi:MFS transporter [Actinocatenispora thailandica]|uniref:Putative proline/betaine transporter n=1 Tax=Actinocatenispora thailandica TaxID=227318 RepID=A0A7R7I0E1_9ACTN|nr:MFS transporter [Actinocatenispora thailandica]BCJ38481.1 MFS transporter [Actinocatenispora thailandica]